MTLSITFSHRLFILCIITVISIHVYHHVPSIPVLNTKSVHNCLVLSVACTNVSIEVTNYLSLSCGYTLHYFMSSSS